MTTVWTTPIQDLPAPPAPPPPGRTARWFWVPPTVLTLAFGLVGLGHRQPWQDEYASWWAATLSWSNLWHLLHHYDIVLAPYYVLLHLWINVFGASAASMRLPSALAMGATAALLVLLGRRLFDPWVGLTAGMVFAVIPMTTRYAQEARPYAFAELTAVASTLLLVRALERPSFGRWAGYAVLIPAMAMAHLVTVLILPAHAVIALRRRRDVLRWLAAAAVGLLPVLPLAYAGHAQSKQISWITGSSPTLAQLPPSLFHSQIVAWTVIAVALLGVLFARMRAWPVLCWAVLPVLLLWATQGVFNLFLSRYLLFTLPAWALLVAAAVCGTVRQLPGEEGAFGRRVAIAAPAVAAALLLLSIPDLAQVRSDPLPGEPDWRDAARAVSRQADPGDGFAVNGYRMPREALAYQLDDAQVAPRDVFQGRTAQALGSFDSGTCAHPSVCAQGVDRIWLFSTQPKGRSFSAMPSAVSHVLASQYKVIEVLSFSSLRVLLLVHVV